ncbi:hypothetical protein ACA910_006554 [Epithemia clementina (nom. ined.)]
MGSIENDERLSAMATFAMKAVTGRRQAKDFLSARNYLDWAKDLSQRLSKSRTELELGLYHFQWAMAVSLPAAQDAVRDFEQKPFEERIDGSSVKEILNLLDERIGLGCESYKKAYADEKNTLTPRPLPGANIKSLASLERMKYLKACGEYEKALQEASLRCQRLEASLEQFCGPSATNVSQLSADLEKHAFRHCRNKYLLLLECIRSHAHLSKRHKVEYQGRGGAPYNNRRLLHQEAIKVCRRGAEHVNSIRCTPHDRLEMGRCLAEALYVSQAYDEARLNCQKLNDKYSLDDTLRPRILRVHAIWIAALRAIIEAKMAETESDESLPLLKEELREVAGIFTRSFEEYIAPNSTAVNNNATAYVRRWTGIHCWARLHSPNSMHTHLSAMLHTKLD